MGQGERSGGFSAQGSAQGNEEALGGSPGICRMALESRDAIAPWRKIFMRSPDGWPGFDASRVRSEFLSAEQYMNCCDQVWSTDRRSSRETSRTRPCHGTLLYAKRDHVITLFPVLEQRRARVILITAEADESVGLSEKMPPQVAGWFSTNSCDPNVFSLPLGLGNSYCKVTAKADLLATVAGMPKTGLLYVNFRPETNPVIRSPLWESYTAGECEGWVTRCEGNASREEFVHSMASHRFILCPRGNGIDTHRMWEALYAGSIPVVERHPALEAFTDLPILFVDDLGGITRTFLEESYAGMIARDWNWEKLFLPWWQKRFETERRKISLSVPWLEYLSSLISKSHRLRSC